MLSQVRCKSCYISVYSFRANFYTGKSNDQIQGFVENLSITMLNVSFSLLHVF